MFEFVFEGFPKQQLTVERAEISIFAFAPLHENRMALYVEVKAEEGELQDPLDPEFTHDIKPRFYTEWLNIPATALRSKGLDCLDGYRMEYDESREAELGFDQSPGAVYSKMHALFTEATMSLDYIEGGRYRLKAEGETEFGWQFRIETEAVLSMISMSSQPEDGAGHQPDIEVERLFDKHFDVGVFQPAWVKAGSDKFSWFKYEGRISRNYPFN